MSNRFEKIYGAILLFVVAALLLGSILYGPSMWGVKVLLAAILLGVGAYFLRGPQEKGN
jgi:hypothetical protein